jgi:hypothetical protein
MPDRCSAMKDKVLMTKLLVPCKTEAISLRHGPLPSPDPVAEG